MKYEALPEYGIAELKFEFFDSYRSLGMAVTFDDGKPRTAFLIRLPPEWDALLDARWRARHPEGK